MKLNLVLATVFMASTLLPATGQAAGGVCPCWTTEILQSIQGGAWCNKVGWHDGQNGEDVSLNGTKGGFSHYAGATKREKCSYQVGGNMADFKSRYDLTKAEHSACFQSIVTECARRGLSFRN